MRLSDVTCSRHSADALHRRDRMARFVILVLWTATALFLASRHVMWRDEVRAFMLATTPGGVLDMLRAVHGEGHPAIWYLLLRGFYTAAPVPQSMPAAAFVVGLAAAALFALRAPFRWPIIALALFGRFALYEYTIVARNYGISMLAMFAFAACYRRWRDNGWVLGGLLLLLCNTNLHSVVLAACLLLFWMVDLIREQPIGWTRPWRAFLIGAALSAVGALLCVATVYPPFNDAAQAAPHTGSIWSAIKDLLGHFDELLPKPLRKLRHVFLIPLLLIGCLAGLARAPGAFVAGLAGLLSLTLVFTVVYDGAFRHQALILPFMLTLAWLMLEGRGGKWPARQAAKFDTPRLRKIGAVAMVLVLALQAGQSVTQLSRRLRGIPESRSADLAQLLKDRGLKDAIVIGDPDYLLEALPYYAANPTYFVRERRYGRYTIFSKAAKRSMTPGLMLDAARELHATTGKPVVVLMSEWVFRQNEPDAYARGFYGDFIATSPDIARFRAGIPRIADFAPVTGGDETYEVFLLTGPAPTTGSALRP